MQEALYLSNELYILLFLEKKCLSIWLVQGCTETQKKLGIEV